MNIIPISIISAITILLFIVTLIFIKKHRIHLANKILDINAHRFRENHQTIKTIKKIPKCTFIPIISIISLLTTSIIIIWSGFFVAHQHGLYTTNINTIDMFKGILYSPIESTLPENIDGSIIIYYRFGCSDCETVYNELSNAVKDKENIYWISTESEQGKKLLETYPVDSVPTGIYIRNDKYENALSYTQKSLITMNNDNIEFNQSGINRLLYLQKQNR